MTDAELATWRARSEQLRLFTLAMDPGPARAAASFAAGAMLGLANRLRRTEQLLGDAKRMAEFGDINADMEDDGIGWKQWYLDVSAVLPP